MNKGKEKYLGITSQTIFKFLAKCSVLLLLLNVYNKEYWDRVFKQKNPELLQNNLRIIKHSNGTFLQLKSSIAVNETTKQQKCLQIAF